MMDLNENESILKLAQLTKLLENKCINKKEIELIIQGLDLNLKIPSTPFLEKYNSNVIGSTILHLAYEKKNLGAFNILMARSADFTAKDKYGYTVLHKSFQDVLTCSSYLKPTNQKRLTKSLHLADMFIESVLSAHIRYRNTSNSSDCDGLTHFHVACAVNNIKAVEWFLNGGVPVNQAACSKRFANYTPLHFAVEFICIDTVKILLKHGANVNLMNTKGEMPIHICIKRIIEFNTRGSIGHAEQLENIRNALLNHYVETRFPFAYVVSTKKNSLQVVEKLLTDGFDVNQFISMNSQVWPGYSVLHFAVLVNIDIAKILIKHGANIMARNATGLTPFQFCLIKYKTEDIFDILRLIPSCKSILLSNDKTKLIDLIFMFKDLDGFSNFLQQSDENVKLFVPFDSPLLPDCTVLHVAVLLSERVHCKSEYESKRSDLTLVRKCLEHGADVTVKDLRNLTPVHLAFGMGKKNTVNLLLKYHHLMINPVDNANLSHLHIACAVGNYDLIEKFLWNKIDVNIVYKGNTFISGIAPGSTPLHVAVSKRDCRTFKLLLKFGANPFAMDYRFYTAINYFLDDDSSCELSKILFSSINFTDCINNDMGTNFLHAACSTKNVGAVRKLLDLGVNVNQSLTVFKTEIRTKVLGIFNKDGNTPLHTTLIHSSFSQEQLEIVNLLIERGADVLMKNLFNISSLHLIMMSPCKTLHETLISVLNSNHCLLRRVESEIGLTMLHLACHKLDFNSMKELLSNGANVNAQIHEDSTFWPGFTPLHVLFSSLIQRDEEDEDIKFIELLLKYHVNVTLSNNKKRTPLHMAYHMLNSCEDRCVDIFVSSLLKAQDNFEINPTNIEGISHFHIACDMLDVDVVEKFLEHNVDVNSRIDMFYNSNDFAACTPLLLVTRKSIYTLAESHAQLKIVDFLLKHGANVNDADILGNTPAHLIATNHCSSMRGNLIQRLANSGADMNARNVRGEAPLELLLNTEKLRHQDVRHFIACGSIFNAFNLVTGVGYIAKFCDVVPRRDTEYLLFGTYVNFPDMVKKDDLNRSAIHNIVSSSLTEAESEEFIECFDILKQFGCDIDDQDTLGRTPLHLAVLFRSLSGVEALLLSGADVNTMDKNNKTPFAYFFESCSHQQCSGICTEEQDDNKSIIGLLVNHIKNLQLCNLYVNELNDKLLTEALQRFHDMAREQSLFLSQVDQLMKLKIEPYSLTIADFMADDAAIVDYPTMSQAKRKAINEFFERNESMFQIKFENVFGVLQLQQRKALKRYEIVDKSLESLTVLTNYQFPYLVSHIIFKFLKNSDLENLIAAAFHGKEMQ